VTFTWTVKKTGDHSFEVKVNPNGATDIKETSYDNNAQTATLKVVPVPPIDNGPGGMLYIIIGVVAIVAVVAVAAVMMRRKPARPASAPPAAEEKVDVVEAETVEPEQK
jgi:subtilase family serine protease